jgi:hypothetical protein
MMALLYILALARLSAIAVTFGFLMVVLFHIMVKIITGFSNEENEE